MVSTCVNFKTNTHVTNLRKDNIFHQENGFLGERIKGGLNYSPWNINKLEISLKNKERVKKVKKPGVVSAVLTSNDATETKTFQVPSFLRRKADPKNVVSIILGGGSGVQLFPLTKRAATPAVPVGGCYRLIDIPMSNCINSGINKVFVLTQFNSASLNRHISRTYFGNGINFGDGYVEVLDVEFHNVKALYRRAQAYIETGDFLLADVDIKKALKVDPQNREVKTLKTKVKQLQADSDKKDAKLYENMFAHKPKRLKVEKEEDEVVKTEMDNVGDSAAPSNGGLIIDSC